MSQQLQPLDPTEEMRSLGPAELTAPATRPVADPPEPQERILAIVASALAAALVMLIITGDRLSWTTALIGAAVIGLLEYSFGPTPDDSTDHITEDGEPEASHDAVAEPVPSAPDWHATAMTAQQAPISVEPAAPRFERPPLATYRSTAQRDLHQCPNCARFTVVTAPNDPALFGCQHCTATWRWEPNEHWPNVRPQPHLQEVT